MFAIKLPSPEQTTAELRSLARKFGLVPYLSRARSFVHRLRGTEHYEALFERALMRQVRGGDVIWDVGANVGLYTTRFSEAVGVQGRVIAFEPAPGTFRELQRRTAGLTNVSAVQAALSDTPGFASMTVDATPLSPTNTLAAHPDAPSVKVAVAVGDQLIATQAVPAPDVIKIDVEGFEQEVLTGLNSHFAKRRCRAVLCEVHFGILDQRGRRQAPARIVEYLRDHGFAVRWVDASHLEATLAV